ncbi:MAG: hypothetical protein ABH859_05880 [Pseudomonadota bacterium]
MTHINDFMKGKSWLIYGSGFGGAIGALLVFLNSLLPMQSALIMDMPQGFMTTTALGMVGGIMGGLLGSLISGVFAKEDLVLNIGSSLGIGVINGFIAGTVVGLILSIIQAWDSKILTPAIVTIAIASLILLAIVIYYFKKK